MSHLFPPIEPYTTGRLKVSELHEIHYEECGNPSGKAAVFLHGGPGVGIVPPYRQFFDPKFWRVVLPDQRGAGKSTPHAELRENTTWELIEDLEKLRKHLGIDKWVVMGGSWGSFLALSYAIMHPQSVKGVIIRGVMLGRKSETDWLFKQGMNWVFPEEWEEFAGLLEANPKFLRKTPTVTKSDEEIVAELLNGPNVPYDENFNPYDFIRDHAYLLHENERLLAYYRMMNSGDPELEKKAVMGWSKWEGAANTLIPPEGEDMFDDLHRAISIGRIECWYTLNNWFLKDDNWLLDNLHKMKDIPLWMVQGRFDMICPVKSAYELHRALPKSKLKIVQLGAHSPMEEPMAEWLVKAGEEVKTL